MCIRDRAKVIVKNKLPRFYGSLCRSLRPVHPFFAQLTLLPNPRNPMLYDAFRSARHPRSAPFRGVICVPVYNMFPWIHRTPHSRVHLKRLSDYDIDDKFGKCQVKLLKSALIDFYSPEVLSDSKQQLLKDTKGIRTMKMCI